MVNGGEREGDGGDGDGTRRTQVREEPAAHDRTPCVQPATQEGGRGRHARSGAAGGGDRTKGIAATGLHLPFEGLTVELKVPSLGTFQRSPRETRDSVRKVTEIAEDWYHARAQASRRCSRDTPLNTESFARKGRSCSPSCSRTLPCACACARVRWIQAVAGMGEAWASVTYRQSRRECPHVLSGALGVASRDDIQWSESAVNVVFLPVNVV
jgi:hypothetical protein